MSFQEWYHFVWSQAQLFLAWYVALDLAAQILVGVLIFLGLIGVTQIIKGALWIAKESVKASLLIIFVILYLVFSGLISASQTSEMVALRIISFFTVNSLFIVIPVNQNNYFLILNKEPRNKPGPSLSEKKIKDLESLIPVQVLSSQGWKEYLYLH